MYLLYILHVFDVLELHFVLLFPQELVLGSLLLDLLAVLLLEFSHLLLVVAIAVPELEVDLIL